MAYSYPSGSNTYTPSFAASGNLIVGFSRNVADFPFNSYIKLVPVTKDTGYYLNLTAEEAARVIDANLSAFVWADNQEAPMGNENTESFSFLPYKTQRYAFPVNLGQKSIEQADWQILSVYSGIVAAKAMTARTVKLWQKLTTLATWGANTGTCTALAGGYLDVSAVATPYIKILFGQGAENILLATLGVVKYQDLIAVMNPHTARLIAKSPEIMDHFKNNVYALAAVRQDVPSQNGKWGLPDMLYGFKIVIEDTVQVTSRKGATRATSFVCPTGVIVFMSRPGGLKGMEGIPDFSTAQLFVYEEMTVETRDDVDNRRTNLRVVEDYVPTIVAPASGYYVTGCTTPGA